jgi:hypothetical protein
MYVERWLRAGEVQKDGNFSPSQRQTIKWVKWKKNLYKMASVKYLKTKYKEKLNLFEHWLLVYP